jgi:hypothetical protein
MSYPRLLACCETDISQAVRSQIGEAQKIASGSGSAQDIAEANVELEVFPEQHQ